MNKICNYNFFNRILHKLAFLGPGGFRLRPFLHRLRGVYIGNTVWISRYVYIDKLHSDSVTIGDNASIGMRTSIIAHFYWGCRRAALTL